MEPILATVAGLIYGISLLFAYRAGMRDSDGKKTHPAAILPPIRRKPEPVSEEEQAAADRQRRIDAFKG